MEEIIMAFAPLTFLIIYALKTRRMAESMVLATLLAMVLLHRRVQHHRHPHHHPLRGGGGSHRRGGLPAVRCRRVLTENKRERASGRVSTHVLHGFLTRLRAGFLVYYHQFTTKEGSYLYGY